MKNKIALKRHFFLITITFCLFLTLFLIIQATAYHTYTKNFNQKIVAIIATLKEKYPSLKEEEIVAILNEPSTSLNLLKPYYIDIEKDSIVIENIASYKLFLKYQLILCISLWIILLALVYCYHQKQSKEIHKITNYLEEINRKNYSLDLDRMSEDELSILKNEIGKTTIMLKESREYSLQEKQNLKKSLEDISHQLKTPLTSIFIILDNLQEDPNMDIEMRENFIRDMKRETMHIHFFVDSILKLSKLDANTISFSPVQIEVRTLIEQVVQNVSTLCELKNIHLEIDCKKEISFACDMSWQVEAITNIVKNCIDYSIPDSRILIKCTSNNVYTHIQIEDFGTGISKQDLPHIFERFYKGKNAKTDSVGIGLALAKSIIEKENGSIQVKSSSKGTIFDIKYFKL